MSDELTDELTDEQARGLADRWACTETPGGCGSGPPECMGPLTDHAGRPTYEFGALLGWVRRECEREAERREAFRAQAEEAGAFAARVSGKSSPPWDANDPEALATHIATKLGGIFEQRPDLARELCRAATEAGRCSNCKGTRKVPAHLCAGSSVTTCKTCGLMVRLTTRGKLFSHVPAGGGDGFAYVGPSCVERCPGSGEQAYVACPQCTGRAATEGGR